MTVSPERIEEAERYLLNKRRLGSLYLEEVRVLIAARHEAVERERLRMRDFLAASERVELVEAENDRLRGLEQDIRTALEHWPGEAHLGTTYYTLTDALERVAVSRDVSEVSAEVSESTARGRGIDEANERQRRLAVSPPADEAKPEPREGMVTVYDWRGAYLGCMGIERWQDLLAADEAKP